MTRWDQRNRLATSEEAQQIADMEDGMTTIRFHEFSIKGTRRWVDVDGRKRQETKTFMQTVNPFNTNAEGAVKSRDEIMQELIEERRQWLAAPTPEKEREKP